MKIKTQQVIECGELDDLIQKTYGRPYCFQQQDGCKGRGNEYVIVPDPNGLDYENDSVKEEVNGPEMGVSFKAWLERDPKQTLPGREDAFGLSLWWNRNFYPSVDMVLNDLHAKGLLPAGEYTINIDW